MSLCNSQQLLSMYSLQVCSIGNRQPPERQTLLDDEVQKVESMRRDALIGGIIEDQRSALI